MKSVFFTLAMIFCSTSFAAAGTCTSLKITSLEVIGSKIYVVPQKIGSTSVSYEKYWKFLVDAKTNPELFNIIKLAFTLGKPITFQYYGTNDDGEKLTNSPACNTVSMYNWETGAEIYKVAILAN